MAGRVHADTQQLKQPLARAKERITENIVVTENVHENSPGLWSSPLIQAAVIIAPEANSPVHLPLYD